MNLAMDVLRDALEDSPPGGGWSTAQVASVTQYDKNHVALAVGEVVSVFGPAWLRSVAQSSERFLEFLVLLVRADYEQRLLAAAGWPKRTSRTPRELLKDSLLVDSLSPTLKLTFDARECWTALEKCQLAPAHYDAAGVDVLAQIIVLRQLHGHDPTPQSLASFAAWALATEQYFGDANFLQASLEHERATRELEVAVHAVDEESERARDTVAEWLDAFGPICRRREHERARCDRAKALLEAANAHPGRSLSELQRELRQTTPENRDVQLDSVSKQGQVAPPWFAPPGSFVRVAGQLREQARLALRFLQFRLSADLLETDPVYRALDDEHRKQLMGIRERVLPVTGSDIVDGLAAHQDVTYASLLVDRRRVAELLSSDNITDTHGINDRIALLRQQTEVMRAAVRDAMAKMEATRADQTIAQMADALAAVEQREHVARCLETQTQALAAEATRLEERLRERGLHIEGGAR
jgi:hypothetical protein